jgi:cation:H+ antiporter
MLLQNLLFFVLGAIGLIISATLIVGSLTKISRFLRLSEFTAAFIIMAIASSSPELFVGLSSALSKVPTLSLGNVLGASIMDLTLITGIFILLGKGIRINRKRTDSEIYYTLFSVFLVIILFLIGNSLSRADGIILLALFIFNLYRVIIKGKNFPEKLKKENIKKIWPVVPTFVIAFIILVLSARFAVIYGSALAVDLELPQIFIGIFLFSFVTVLPEFIFGIKACKMKHKGMAIGDITGGIFTNFTLVLGLVAIISPIKADFLNFMIPAVFLFASILIFLKFLKSENKLKIEEGIGLIILYILFIVIEFFIKP